MRQCLELPDPFTVEVWVDTVMDRSGVDALGPYPEVYWLPHLGPSTLLAARRLLCAPGTWDKMLLAQALGIGHKLGRNSTLERSLARLEAFRLAHDTNGVLHVRRYWPRVPANLLAKMDPFLQVGELDLAAA